MLDCLWTPNPKKLYLDKRLVSNVLNAASAVCLLVCVCVAVVGVER